MVVTHLIKDISKNLFLTSLSCFLEKEKQVLKVALKVNLHPIFSHPN